MHFSRRRFIGGAGGLVVAGGTGLLAACQAAATPAPHERAGRRGRRQPPAARDRGVAQRGGQRRWHGPAVPAGAPCRWRRRSPPRPVAAAAPRPRLRRRQRAQRRPVAAAGGGRGRQADVPAGRAALRPQSVRGAAAGHTAPSLRRGSRRKTCRRTRFSRAPTIRARAPSVRTARSTSPTFPGMLFALRDSPSAADQLEVAWRFHPPASSSLHATPALSSDGSTVYLAFASGGFNSPSPKATLYALKAPASGTDPQVVWTADLGATRVVASPTVGPDGTIYIANAMGQLFAVAANGSIKWTGPDRARRSSRRRRSAADGTVYHATSDGKMYAVSPQGQVKWTFDFGAAPWSDAAGDVRGRWAGWWRRRDRHRQRRLADDRPGRHHLYRRQQQQHVRGRARTGA